MSTVVIALGLYFLAALPATYGEAVRYQRAEPCEGDGSEPAHCLEIVSGTVERKFSRGGGRSGDDHHLDVRVGETATFPPHRQPKEVEIEDTFGDPVDEDADIAVYDELRTGDRVELGYWGRQLARVTEPGVGSVETIASPVFGSGATLSLGPLLPVLGALGWWGAIVLRRRSRSWRRKASFGSSAPSLPRAVGIGAMFGVSIAVVAVGDSAGTDLGLVVAAWVFGAMAGAALVLVIFAVVALVRRLRN